jgi:hypothetical protein
MNVWGSANNHNKSVYSPFGWLCHGKFEEAQVGHF